MKLKLTNKKTETKDLTEIDKKKMKEKGKKP